MWPILNRNRFGRDIRTACPFQHSFFFANRNTETLSCFAKAKYGQGNQILAIIMKNVGICGAELGNQSWFSDKTFGLQAGPRIKAKQLLQGKGRGNS